MEEPRQEVPFLGQRAESFIESVLRPMMDDPVVCRDKELGWNCDRARVGDDAFSDIVQSEQDVYCDRPNNLRVSFE